MRTNRPDLSWLAVYAVFGACLIADGGTLLLIAWLTR